MTRDSARLYVQGDPRSVFLEPDYDVLERVVTFTPRGGALLSPGLLYEVEVIAPASDGAPGFRAYDGAPLHDSGPVLLSFSFRTSTAVPPAPPAPPGLPRCTDFVDALDRGACLQCHSAGLDPPMGLALGSAQDLRDTAVGRVAHETATGAIPGHVLVDPPRFGTNMAVIAPGDPGSSYLLYKGLEGATAYEPDGCTSSHRVALPPGQCLAPDAAELARMQSWFLPLAPMPPAGQAGLTLPDLRAVQAFIRAGAPLDGCQ